MKQDKIFMLDNLDSFTYNLVDEFYQLGFKPEIYRNTLSADFIFNKMCEHQETTGENVILVLSPGPGNPSQAGCLMALIEKVAGKFPIIGICLGHQALVQHFGGEVGRANAIVHGKASMVEHSQTGAFEGIANPLSVARYHSLMATKMPEQLITTAKTDDIVMAIEHKTLAIIGFQFHPESILTNYGSALLKQAMSYLAAKHTETLLTGSC
ncbi:aminodeoxychorismate/anthranilate synthase component II [Thalassotalea sp. LPB0316]|uniref:aminodeoxychorismate/anthranilate synthase component II n=1 Tax=Thalassotalea sp. LPB0316 TaxID=2769490 RepID=UPI0018665A05|nr:aminodeoxychorismate/anthranilate synthase component II [Thalassotalea sp. LPB0316]QOL24677.1 aminodeoxychorismate/anthranilate synthase component II [Thalassotalea sp. LPB0316]